MFGRCRRHKGSKLHYLFVLCKNPSPFTYFRNKMDLIDLDNNPAVVPKYDLDDEQEKKEIVRHYRALLRSLRTKLKKGDKELLRTAFEMAADAHKTMRRKSGEPYILHPLAVAMICVDEIGLGVRSTICALLHDTVEDTDIALDDIKNEFGNEIAKIVDGLTKISTIMERRGSRSSTAPPAAKCRPRRSPVRKPLSSPPI